MDSNMREHPTFEFIAKYFDTDKVEHGYMPFYEKHMPTNPKRILEIGCFKGESIRMWKFIFPDAEIHCLDLFEENPMPDIPGVRFWKGNQCDYKMLELLRNFNFDVIIDDGSHNSRDQMMTFYGLAHAGCHYFIEDLACQREEFYSQGLPKWLNADNHFSHYIFKEGDIMLVKC